MGYKEIRHTADQAIRVWGKNIESLFQEAARGMYELMNIQPDPQLHFQTQFTIQENDDESQLVAFLSELLFLVEEENAVFDKIRFAIDDNKLITYLDGFRIRSIDRIIKAVTFNNLEIRHKQNRYEVEIVFDV